MLPIVFAQSSGSTGGDLRRYAPVVAPGASCPAPDGIRFSTSATFTPFLAALVTAQQPAMPPDNQDIGRFLS